MIDWLRAPVQPVVEVAGRALPVVARRHPTARRMVLRLAPDGGSVRITLPRGVPVREALRFARDRAGWLEAQLARTAPPRCPFEEGAIPLEGASVVLRHDEAAPRTPVLADGALTIGGPRDAAPARLRRWLRARALEYARADTGHYAGRAGLPSPDVRLTEARRRWGSCSAAGVVRLNWRLVMAPPAIRRSVAAHEVAHLLHMDHSPAFHAAFARIYDDDARAADRWLKANGPSLYAPFG